MSEITTSTSGKFFPSNIVFIFIQPEFRNSNERRSKPGVAKTPKRSASKSILVFGTLFHWLDVVAQRSDDCRRLRGRMYCLRYGRFAPGSYFIFHCGIRVQVNLVTINPSKAPILGGDAGNIETDVSQFHSVVIKDLRQISSRSSGTQCVAPSIIRQSHLLRNHASCR
jgi:hypothetical protein